MITIDNLLQVANQIETERGVQRDILFTAIEQALASACRKKFTDGSQIVCELNTQDCHVSFYRVKEVTEDIISPMTEITLKEAKKINPKAVLGDEIPVYFDPPGFGRTAALVAKQVIMQRLREAEKDSIYEDFLPKVGRIINGSVQRIENQNYLVNLGRTESILRLKDQIPGESFQAGETVRVYVVDIEKTSRGNIVHISRTHPGFLQCLFELEIPEIADGIIEVKSVSRVPGVRAKVAVRTNNESIGAVGTCVGQMGGRIQAVIKEIGGSEKIDVLEWADDARQFISNALKPAKISHVYLTNVDERQATVVVPNDQLSLAIGKQGINVRLSVSLTKWNLNIMSDSDFQNSDIKIPESFTQSNLKFSAESEKKEELSLQYSSLAQAISRSIQKEQAESQLINSEDEQLMKVTDLAKMLGYKTKELMDKAESKGIIISSSRAKLSAELVNEIKGKL